MYNVWILEGSAKKLGLDIRHHTAASKLNVAAGETKYAIFISTILLILYYSILSRLQKG